MSKHLLIRRIDQDQVTNEVLNSPSQTRTGVSTPYPFTALAPPSFLSHPDTSNLIIIQCRRQLILFDMLPDDVLLGLFDFYADEDVDEDFEPSLRVKAKQKQKQRIEAWITLAHVCRRWRSVVFQSPRRLNMRLLCKTKTPARDTLDVWPPLPLIIQESFVILKRRSGTSGLDNIVAALEHNDRVCQIDLQYPSTLRLKCVAAGMQKPFPELTDLRLSIGLYDVMGSLLPDSFLGGTAPRLRSLDLLNVPFPGLPNLLLSATHLVYLSLHDIPWSGYIPPEVMATSLSALTGLEFLRLHFRCPHRPTLESRRPPPPTRSILPSLTKIHFKGASEYLEEILARIDAPRLGGLHIAFFNQITSDTPQLFQFISRRPTLRAPQKGVIECNPTAITVGFPSQTSDYRIVHSVVLLCTASEGQLSSLEQVCTSSLPPVSTVEDLYISENKYWQLHGQDDVENTLWLNLLRSFVVVKNLYLSVEYVPRIAPALQELVGGRTTELLPTLENIFLEDFQPSGSLQEGIEKFVAARRLTSHPVAVSRWDRWNHRELYIEDCDRY